MLERLLTNKMLTLSLAAIIFAAVVVVLQLPGIGSALLVPGINDDKTPTLLRTSLEEHDKEMTTFRNRFEGRSIFFMPDPPPVVVARTPAPVDEGPKEPPKPPPPEKPTAYGGPEVLALLGDEVHLAGNKILKLGVTDDSLGLTVLEFVPPWSVRVNWLKKPGNYEAAEFVVEMFKGDLDAVVAKAGDSSSPTIDGLTQAEDQSAEVAPPSPPQQPRSRGGSSQLREN